MSAAVGHRKFCEHAHVSDFGEQLFGDKSLTYPIA